MCFLEWLKVWLYYEVFEMKKAYKVKQFILINYFEWTGGLS